LIRLVELQTGSLGFTEATKSMYRFAIAWISSSSAHAANTTQETKCESWTSLTEAIGAAEGGVGTFTLPGKAFDCDFESQIQISALQL
jgi:hypothetical protein